MRTDGIDLINGAIEKFGKQQIASLIKDNGALGSIRGIFTGVTVNRASIHSTCTIVEHGGITCLVTATHCLKPMDRDGEYTFKKLFVQVSSGKFLDLCHFEWRSLTVLLLPNERSMNNELENVEEDYYDLSIAIITDELREMLCVTSVSSVRSAYCFNQQSIAVMIGFIANRNRNQDLMKHGLRGTNIRVPIHPIKKVYQAPYQKPVVLSEGTFLLPIDRRRSFGKGMNAPEGKGMSGGPLVYLGNFEQCIKNEPTPCVIGFIFRLANKTYRIVKSDLLIDFIEELYPRQFNPLSLAIGRELNPSAV